MAFDVFISYPHQDKAAADAACARLEAEGIRCWIAPRDVPPGAEWAGAIVDAIDQCRAMVLIFSSSTNASRQIHREVQRAFDREVPVVSLRIENVVPEKALAYYMATVHWLDAMTPPLESHLHKLVASVKALTRIEPPAVKNGQPRDQRDSRGRFAHGRQRGRPVRRSAGHLAQAGSAGGNIGNVSKSLSGSEPEARPLRAKHESHKSASVRQASIKSGRFLAAL
jgi:TIR domain